MKQYTWKTKDDDSWDNDCFGTQIKCVEDATEQGYEPEEVLLIGETEEIPIGGDYFRGVQQDQKSDLRILAHGMYREGMALKGGRS